MRANSVLNLFWVQAGAGALLLVALSFRVWINVYKTDLGYELAKERNVMIRLDMERRELEMKLSVAKRPDYLRTRAKTLGLEEPNSGQVVRMRER
jgi:hypothetical protein